MSARTILDFSTRVVLIEAHPCAACGNPANLSRIAWTYDDGVDPHGGVRYFFGGGVRGDVPDIDYGPDTPDFESLVAQWDAFYANAVKQGAPRCGCGWGGSCSLDESPNYDPFGE